MPDFELFDPSEYMRKLEKRMQRMFPSESFAGKFIREPLVDIMDKGKHLLLVAEMPGVDKKDIKINVTEDSVSIGAEQKHSVKEEKKKEGYFYKERGYKRYFRQVSLPSIVIPSKSVAEYKNGVLELKLPKKKPVKKENSIDLKVK